MRIGLVTFSVTGNTALAVTRACDGLRGQDFVEVPESGQLESVDALILAAPAFYRAIPLPFATRLRQLRGGRGQPTLLLATYGAMVGRTLLQMAELARNANLNVVAATALLMPESFPPFVARGWSTREAPRPKELASFDEAITRFGVALRGDAAPSAKVGASLFERLLPATSRESAVRKLKGLSRDPARCGRCGLCRDKCPAGAIGWSEGPVFSPGTCIACFGCYNRCPTAAIEAGCMKRRDGRYRPAALGVATRVLARTEASGNEPNASRDTSA